MLIAGEKPAKFLNLYIETRLIYCGKLSSFGVKSELAERLTKPCSFDKPTGGTPAFVTWEKPDYKFGSPQSLHNGGSAFRLE